MEFECPDRADWNWDVEYQWNLSRNNCVKIDSDAVGIGVTTSFVISASALLLTVVIGYWTSSIPADILTGFDGIFVSSLQALTRGRPSDKHAKKRIDALVHFLLALADQQMITALALLIAGYAHWYDITIYAMNVTGALTLLSSAVYLSVLPITTARDREYKKLSLADRSHRPRFSQLLGLAKHFRLISVVCIFLGMAVLFVLSEGSSWWPAEDSSDLYFLCGVRHFSIPQGYVFTAIINFFILLGFASGYVDAVMCLYTQQTSWIMWIVRRLETRWGVKDSTPLDYYLVARAGTLDKHHLYRWKASFLEESFAFHSFHESFAAWQLLQLVFAMVYGTINVFCARSHKLGLTGDANTWGFGQIVPMILLALPALAAFEARNDYKTSKDSPDPTPGPQETHRAEINPTAEAAPALKDDEASIVRRYTESLRNSDPGSSPRVSQHPKLDNCGQEEPDLLRWPRIRFRMYVHGLLSLIISMLLAVSTALWNLGSEDLTITSRLCFGYTLVETVRNVYGPFVIALCLKKAEKGGIQFRHVSWVGLASKAVCVVLFIALLSTKMIGSGSDSVLVRDLYYITMGTFLAPVIWALVAVVPVFLHM